MALISVIVPVYRVEKLLSRCLKSVLNQSLSDFELLLVDDGSDDESALILDETAFLDERIVSFHQKNGGPALARNVALDYSQNASDSKYIAFVDSDDWLELNYLELLYKACAEQNVTISMCGAQNEYDRNIDKHEEQPLPENVNGMIETEKIFSIDYPFPFFAPHDPWGKLILKKYLTSLRFPVGKMCEDLFLMYKILFQTKNMYFVGIPLYHYYINKDGLTRARWAPRCMDVDEAHEELIEYFRNLGIDEARLHMEKALIDGIFINMWEIRNLGTGEFKFEYDLLKRKLRKVLRLYRKELNLGYFTKYDYYAYPNIMKVVSVIRRKR